MEDIQNLVKIHEWKENKQIVKLSLKLDSSLKVKINDTLITAKDNHLKIVFKKFSQKPIVFNIDNLAGPIEKKLNAINIKGNRMNLVLKKKQAKRWGQLQSEAPPVLQGQDLKQPDISDISEIQKPVNQSQSNFDLDQNNFLQNLIAKNFNDDSNQNSFANNNSSTNIIEQPKQNKKQIKTSKASQKRNVFGKSDIKRNKSPTIPLSKQNKNKSPMQRRGMVQRKKQQQKNQFKIGRNLKKIKKDINTSIHSKSDNSIKQEQPSQQENNFKSSRKQQNNFKSSRRQDRIDARKKYASVQRMPKQEQSISQDISEEPQKKKVNTKDLQKMVQKAYKKSVSRFKKKHRRNVSTGYQPPLKPDTQINLQTQRSQNQSGILKTSSKNYSKLIEMNLRDTRSLFDNLNMDNRWLEREIRNITTSNDKTKSFIEMQVKIIKILCIKYQREQQQRLQTEKQVQKLMKNFKGTD